MAPLTQETSCQILMTRGNVQDSETVNPKIVHRLLGAIDGQFIMPADLALNVSKIRVHSLLVYTRNIQFQKFHYMHPA